MCQARQAPQVVETKISVLYNATGRERRILGWRVGPAHETDGNDEKSTTYGVGHFEASYEYHEGVSHSFFHPFIPSQTISTCPRAQLEREAGIAVPIRALLP